MGVNYIYPKNLLSLNEEGSEIRRIKKFVRIVVTILALLGSLITIYKFII